jgi:hypothetical protein
MQAGPATGIYTSSFVHIAGTCVAVHAFTHLLLNKHVCSDVWLSPCCMFAAAPPTQLVSARAAHA